MTLCTSVNIPTFLGRFSCSEMSHCAVGYLVSDISKEHSTFIFSNKKPLFWAADPEDEGTVIIWIVKITHTMTWHHSPMELNLKQHGFFFYWLYNPGWVLVCSTILFHSCLYSTFALQPIIFILFRSSSTWSIHLNLGLPTGLVLYGIHSVIFLVVIFSILITWAAHLSLCDFINFIISSCFVLCLSSSFALILHVPSGFCVSP